MSAQRLAEETRQRKGMAQDVLLLERRVLCRGPILISCFPGELLRPALQSLSPERLLECPLPRFLISFPPHSHTQKSGPERPGICFPIQWSQEARLYLNFEMCLEPSAGTYILPLNLYLAVFTWM